MQYKVNKGDQESRDLINALYLEIGRGHPFYLDGVLEALARRCEPFARHDITEISRGITKAGWKLINNAYHLGARGGLTSRLYSLLRQRGTSDDYGLMKRILARDIRAFSQATAARYIVSHPLIISMISPEREVYYMHGEIAAPSEAASSRAEIIFVPLDATKASFAKSGVESSKMIVTGLCIEHFLVEQAGESYEKRCARLSWPEALTGAFFSSGAEPPPHIRKLLRALISLKQTGHSAIVFCRKGGRFERKIKTGLGIEPIGASSLLSEPDRISQMTGIRAYSFTNRDEENQLTARFFEQFDYMVAPSHERTNWALGLGLPTFILHPLIGPYAPLNCRFLLDSGAALDLRDDLSAESLGEFISVKHNREVLLKMAESNFGKYKIDGFSAVADYIAGLEKTAK